MLFMSVVNDFPVKNFCRQHKIKSLCSNHKYENRASEENRGRANCLLDLICHDNFLYFHGNPRIFYSTSSQNETYLFYEIEDLIFFLILLFLFR